MDNLFKSELMKNELSDFEKLPKNILTVKNFYSFSSFFNFSLFLKGNHRMVRFEKYTKPMGFE
jgi:hypothetical protein